MTPIAFTVFGKAQPAGSKKAFVNQKTGKMIVTDDNAKARPWKQQVAGAARSALNERGLTGLLHGPIELTVSFIVPRPRGHFGTGRNADTIKASSPAHPTKKPDATKMLRGLEDALTGIVWRDDAQVVSQHVTKEFGEPARACVFIRELDDDPTTGVTAVTPFGPTPVAA